MESHVRHWSKKPAKNGEDYLMLRNICTVRWLFCRMRKPPLRKPSLRTEAKIVVLFVSTNPTFYVFILFLSLYLFSSSMNPLLLFTCCIFFLQCVFFQQFMVHFFSESLTCPLSRRDPLEHSTEKTGCGEQLSCSSTAKFWVSVKPSFSGYSDRKWTISNFY